MPAKSKQILKPIGKVIKYTLLVFNGIAVLLLLLSALAWYIAPSKFALPAYLGLGFPIILVVNVLFIIIWLIVWKWKFALAQFVILIFFYSPIFTYFPIHFRTSNVPNDCIKVLTYNVQGFNWLEGRPARNNPMINYIVKSDADIVCMQEFLVAKREISGGIISLPELNKIMKKYPHRSVIEASERGARHMYGLAVYSKYPITEVKKIPMNSSDNGAALFKLNIKGKQIVLFNNHLESNRITAEDKMLYRQFLKTGEKTGMIDAVTQNIQERLSTAYRIREKQVDIVSKYIQRYDSISDGIIVCGDFNDAPNSYTYHQMRGHLEDSYASTGLGPGVTYNERMFLFRIDFILHSSNFKSYNCRVGNVKYSDHYPVWTYLQMK